MGWSWRKSVDMGGGLRSNLSRRGIGLSFGVKGLRIARTGGRTMLRAGRGSLRYQKTLGSALRAPDLSSAPEVPPNWLTALLVWLIVKGVRGSLQRVGSRWSAAVHPGKPRTDPEPQSLASAAPLGLLEGMSTPPIVHS
jgi:hypothetical protein